MVDVFSIGGDFLVRFQVQWDDAKRCEDLCEEIASGRYTIETPASICVSFIPEGEVIEKSMLSL